MSIHRGACHCGGVTVEYDTAVPPAETELRACQCSFCRMHGAEAVSDPDGLLRFRDATAGAMRRYTFGLKTADFILCGICGAYMGAVMADDTGPKTGPGFGIVNTRVLADRSAFTRPAAPSVYDGEDLAGRIARRRARWTPMAPD